MGESIKELRKKRGLTQKMLSEKSCVPRVCISRYENGKGRPNMKNAEKLAEALGVTIDDLIGKAG